MLANLKNTKLVPANLSITVDSLFFNLIITCKYYTCPLSSFKAKQEKRKAHLQQQIHIREHKMAEVRSSVTDCKVKTVTYVWFFCFVCFNIFALNPPLCLTAFRLFWMQSGWKSTISSQT